MLPIVHSPPPSTSALLFLLFLPPEPHAPRPFHYLLDDLHLFYLCTILVPRFSISRTDCATPSHHAPHGLLFVDLIKACNYWYTTRNLIFDLDPGPPCSLPFGLVAKLPGLEPLLWRSERMELRIPGVTV